MLLCVIGFGTLSMAFTGLIILFSSKLEAAKVSIKEVIIDANFLRIKYFEYAKEKEICIEKERVSFEFYLAWRFTYNKHFVLRDKGSTVLKQYTSKGFTQNQVEALKNELKNLDFKIEEMW